MLQRWLLEGTRHWKKTRDRLGGVEVETSILSSNEPASLVKYHALLTTYM